MKKLVTAAALAAVIMSPAFAQSGRLYRGEPGPAAFVPWDAVVEGGKIVGQVPDANVRLELCPDADGPNRG